MNKLLSLSLIILSFVVVTAMRADVQAEFKFAEETHDFGKIPQGKPIAFDFKFTNIGDAPLIVTDVVTNCGCTVPKFSNIPVKKGESGVISVIFNAAVAGSFNKVITVKSTARTPVKLLYIKGQVLSAVSQ